MSIQSERKVFPWLQTFIARKLLYVDYNFFFQNLTQGVFIQHISTLQHLPLLLHEERLIDNQFLSTCSPTCFQLWFFNQPTISTNVYLVMLGLYSVRRVLAVDNFTPRWRTSTLGFTCAQWRTEGGFGGSNPPEIPKLGQIPRSVENKSVAT
jgi:hypothetical protein